MLLTQLIPILQAAVGPVIVVSGVGLLLLSMTNRLGRVVDRSRQLMADLRRGGGADAESRVAQLGILDRRAWLIRNAILLATLSVLLAALLVISLFLLAALGLNDATACAFLFVGCLACLIASLVFFLLDINLSLAALKLETGSVPTMDGGIGKSVKSED